MAGGRGRNGVGWGHPEVPEKAGRSRRAEQRRKLVLRPEDNPGWPPCDCRPRPAPADPPGWYLPSHSLQASKRPSVSGPPPTWQTFLFDLQPCLSLTQVVSSWLPSPHPCLPPTGCPEKLGPRWSLKVKKSSSSYAGPPLGFPLLLWGPPAPFSPFIQPSIGNAD